jgi:hypothetical protein
MARWARSRHRLAARTGPRPVLDPFAEAGLHGVLDDVAIRVLQVLVVSDDPRDEPVLDQVPPPLVAVVVPLGDPEVQPVHAARELLLRRLDDEVEVVAHQAPRVKRPAKAANGAEEIRGCGLPVVAVVKDPHAVHAPDGDVEDAVREMVSRQARHSTDRRSGKWPARPAGQDRHTFGAVLQPVRAWLGGTGPRDCPWDTAETD